MRPRFRSKTRTKESWLPLATRPVHSAQWSHIDWRTIPTKQCCDPLASAHGILHAQGTPANPGLLRFVFGGQIGDAGMAGCIPSGFLINCSLITKFDDFDALSMRDPLGGSRSGKSAVFAAASQGKIALAYPVIDRSGKFLIECQLKSIWDVSVRWQNYNGDPRWLCLRTDHGSNPGVWFSRALVVNQPETIVDIRHADQDGEHMNLPPMRPIASSPKCPADCYLPHCRQHSPETTGAPTCSTTPSSTTTPRSMRRWF